jgi:hypothetical protein
MNERIQKMYEAARVAAGQEHQFETTNLDVAEKFAELIVDECLAICEELGDKGMDGHYCADEIQKRFGLRQLANVLAGAENNSGDGGYSIGTKENYDAFVAKRNYHIPKVE